MICSMENLNTRPRTLEKRTKNMKSPPILFTRRKCLKSMMKVTQVTQTKRKRNGLSTITNMRLPTNKRRCLFHNPKEKNLFTTLLRAVWTVTCRRSKILLSKPSKWKRIPLKRNQRWILSSLMKSQTTSSLTSVSKTIRKLKLVFPSNRSPLQVRRMHLNPTMVQSRKDTRKNIILLLSWIPGLWKPMKTMCSTLRMLASLKTEEKYWMHSSRFLLKRTMTRTMFHRRVHKLKTLNF